MPGPTRGLPPLILLLLLAPPGAEPRDLVTQPRAPASAHSRSYRTDAVLVRLTDEATRAWVRSRKADAIGGRVGRGRVAAPPARLERLGLPGVDAALSALSGVTLEPEFRGGLEPDTGTIPDLAAFWIAHLSTAAGGSSWESAAQALRRASEVVSVERIAILPVEAVPNDSLWNAAYYFYQSSRRDVHGPEAWDVTRGDTSIVVAIIDTGVLPYHPDLQTQIWTNWAERAGVPGVDDDGNGFVDDVHGWDFVDLPPDLKVQPGEDGRDQDNDPNDFAGHGTAVAGVIGAQTDNGIGVVGTAWQVRLMPLRAGWSSLERASGEIDMSYVAQAIEYAVRNGASVINCSFSSVYQPDLEAALVDANRAGVTIVAAAGNNDNPDHYLGDRAEVISVAATDENDQVTRFSNRGYYVDLAAPGLSIATTSLARPGADSLGKRQPTYTVFANGTSFSAPLVSGAVALLQAQRLHQMKPPLSPAEARLRLVETADDITAENPGDTGFGSGRLNLYRALTDPPPQYATEERRVTVGPAVVLPTLSGSQRYAVVTTDGRLLIIEGASGRTFASVALSYAPQGGLAAADLGAGRGVGMFVATTNGLIHGFDAGGNRLPGWPVTATTSSDGSSAMPVLGDLDGDGIPEVIWAGNNGYVWAWRVDGSTVDGFPRYMGGGSNLMIAVSDLDGQPGAEIIVTSVSPDLVSVLRGDGSSLPNWPRRLLQSPLPPVIMRLGHDPRPVMVVATGNTIHAFDVDGSERWESSFAGIPREPLAVADLDGDGSDEIILPQTSAIAVLDSAGHQVPYPPLPVLPGVVLGPIAVGPLGPNGAPGFLQFITGNQLLAFDSTGVMIAGFPKHEGAGVMPTLADLNQDGRTDILAGSGLDSLIHVYDAGPRSWRAGSDPGWPTARGNFARTGSRLYAPPMTASDNLPPDPVTDLAPGEIGTSSLEITWTAPRDSGSDGRVRRYDLRHSNAVITVENFASGDRVEGVPTPGEPGTHERIVASNLTESTTHYFAVRSFDAIGNPSPISNLLSVSTRTIIPARVNDLRVVATHDTSLVLSWTATGDDGTQGRPRLYELRASQQPLDEASFDQAPIALDVAATVDAGGRESSTLGGIKRGIPYWIALKAVDAANNRSPLSNLVLAETGVGPLTGIALSARTQPAHPPVEIDWQGQMESGGRSQEIRIYDVTGRLRRRFALGTKLQGLVVWDGRDSNGHDVGSGVYLARLVSGRFHTQSRIVLLR